MPRTQIAVPTLGNETSRPSKESKVEVIMKLTPRSEAEYLDAVNGCNREHARLKKEKGSLSAAEYFDIWCLKAPFKIEFIHTETLVPTSLSEDVTLAFPTLSLPGGLKKVIEEAAALIQKVPSRDEKVWARFKQVELEFNCYAKPVKPINKGKGKAPESTKQGDSTATWMIAVQSVSHSNLKEIK